MTGIRKIGVLDARIIEKRSLMSSSVTINLLCLKKKKRKVTYLFTDVKNVFVCVDYGNAAKYFFFFVNISHKNTENQQ